ncbi:hypothetical protein MKW92_043970, partial [Papaver armeniacum]
MLSDHNKHQNLIPIVSRPALKILNRVSVLNVDSIEDSKLSINTKKMKSRCSFRQIKSERRNYQG